MRGTYKLQAYHLDQSAKLFFLYQKIDKTFISSHVHPKLAN